MGLMDSLGLENVEADPNALPDGKWPGVISKSEYVLAKQKDIVNHVISYLVTDGDRKGAIRQEWFGLVKGATQDENGNWVGGTPVMSEQQKPWYKKRLMDLGVPETAMSSFKPEDLVGKEVTFGTKKNGEFININFVELRNPASGGFANPALTEATPAPANFANLV